MTTDCRRRLPESAWIPLRWPVSLPALLVQPQAAPRRVTVVDLSVTGCRVHVTLADGDSPVRITLDGIAPLAATIAWHDKAFAALAFRRPLHPAVAAHLVAQHPAAVRDHDLPTAERARGEAALRGARSW